MRSIYLGLLLCWNVEYTGYYWRTFIVHLHKILKLKCAMVSIKPIKALLLLYKKKNETTTSIYNPIFFPVIFIWKTCEKHIFIFPTYEKSDSCFKLNIQFSKVSIHSKVESMPLHKASLEDLSMKYNFKTTLELLHDTVRLFRDTIIL